MGLHRVGILSGPLWSSWELDSMSLEGPFQLGIFCNFLTHRVMNTCCWGAWLRSAARCPRPSSPAILNLLGPFSGDHGPQGNAGQANRLARGRLVSGQWKHSSDQNLETRQLKKTITRQCFGIKGPKHNNVLAVVLQEGSRVPNLLLCLLFLFKVNRFMNTWFVRQSKKDDLDVYSINSSQRKMAMCPCKPISTKRLAEGTIHVFKISQWHNMAFGVFFKWLFWIISRFSELSVGITSSYLLQWNWSTKKKNPLQNREQKPSRSEKETGGVAVILRQEKVPKELGKWKEEETLRHCSRVWDQQSAWGLQPDAAGAGKSCESKELGGGPGRSTVPGMSLYMAN